jgi:pimeloyl-ACP methyl ester carboxylesterase
MTWQSDGGNDMSHQYRHRSPFHLRIPAEPAETPLVIVDGPSPLGTAASTFIALGLLGAAAAVHATSVAELRPGLRSQRLPSVTELADALRRKVPWPSFDVIGVGIGATVALRLALDGGAVRRVVAVDAPVPSYAAGDVLVTERFFREAPRRPLTSRDSDRQPVLLDRPTYADALPVGLDPSWFRRDSEDGPGRWRREAIPSIPDHELIRFDRPLLCVNSPRSALVTGGDHVARVVPTSRLLRLSTMDPADEAEQDRVADVLADFLQGEVPGGAAYRAARPGVPGATIAGGGPLHVERVVSAGNRTPLAPG